MSPLLLLLLLLLGCGEPEEAEMVQLSMAVSSDRLVPVTTDLGYEVELTEARMAVRDLTFATAGELHTASLLRRLHRAVVPTALAHPGHAQGGDVIGELAGDFLLDWLPGKKPSLGKATLLEGSYSSMNFILRVAGPEDVSQESDELIGHSALLRGTATKGEETIEFVAQIDAPEDRQLIGIPFEPEGEESDFGDALHQFRVTTRSQERLLLKLETRDPLEGDSLFDGVDFLAVDDDGDGTILIRPDAEVDAEVDAYNQLRRTLLTHDQYVVVPVSD